MDWRCVDRILEPYVAIAESTGLVVEVTHRLAMQVHDDGRREVQRPLHLIDVSGDRIELGESVSGLQFDLVRLIRIGVHSYRSAIGRVSRRAWEARRTSSRVIAAFSRFVFP